MELCVYEQITPLHERIRARFQGSDGLKLQKAAVRWAKSHKMTPSRTFIDSAPSESMKVANWGIKVSGYADAPVLTVR